MKKIKNIIGEVSRRNAVKRVRRKAANSPARSARRNWLRGEKILVCDLKREHRAIRKEIEVAVRRVLDSGWYILGKELEAFELEFARHAGSSYAVGVASGTEALQLALMALSIGKGDEVITAVNTAIPTAMAIVSAGARPSFVDVDEAISNISIAGLEKAITRKTKAIIPVHLYGNPCDMDAIIKIARKYRIPVIEDCAQAHGASYKNKKIGTFGNIGAYSFYPTKNLGCYGDGGAIVTDNKKLAEKIKLLRNYGQPTRYLCDIEGINSRLDEIQAAILRVKLKRLDRSIKRRIEIASLYGKYLNTISEVTLPVSLSGSKHSFHLYVIRCKRRDALKEHLAESGIETQIHYPMPLHVQKAFKSLGYKNGDFPVAEKRADEILSLPIFPALKNSEIRAICDKIKGFYNKY